MSANNYLIREARVEDQAALVSFLQLNFYPRKYLNVTYLEKNQYRIDKTEKHLYFEDIKNKCTAMVTNLPTIVAIHKETNIIVGMNVMLVKENPKFMSAADTSEKKYSRVINSLPNASLLMAELTSSVSDPLNNSVDFFAEFPKLQTALKILCLCVEKDHGGLGLGTRLIHETTNYARCRGIGIVYGLFTTPSAQKAAAKNEFKKFSYIDILSLRDKDGNRIYEGTKSHFVSVMGKVL